MSSRVPRQRLRTIGSLITASAVLYSTFVKADQSWPRPDAPLTAVVEKIAGAEMTDTVWGHLHHGDVGLTVHTQILDQNTYRSADSTTEVRYLVRGVPISNWLPLPANFDIDLANTGLPAKDGIHDLSVEVRGNNAELIKPYPMFLHIGRHQSAPEETVPVIAQNMEALGNLKPAPFGTAYVRAADRNMVGHPADMTTTPWTLPPHQADLYQIPMQPHSDHFEGAQMWWEEPAGTINEGLKFVRSLAPKAGEFFLGLYNANGDVPPTDFASGGLRTLPMKDGPRGVGWTNGYISGQVDSHGGFVHVNKAGSVRYMRPDGELITVAGWRVKLDKDPVWILKPLASIRQNEEFRGTWTEGLYADQYDPGFHQPMDITIDPQNDSIWYVAGLYDNCIWKVVVDRTNWTSTVSVFAGDPGHTAGYADGVGHAARFNKPFSLVFDPISDSIYVSDHNNDAIRKITRDGTVTTMFGRTGFADSLLSLGLASRDERIVANPVVAADHARLTGANPDIFAPYTVRVDSRGRLIIFDRGFNTIRRFDVATRSAEMIARLQFSHDGGQTWGFANGGFGEWARGWAWLDVDRYGNSGPLDSIYFAMATSYATPRNDAGQLHFNEEWWWISSDGSQQTYLSDIDHNATPESWGPLNNTDLPHYPWAVAVDPRGGLYLTGVGEHGITRVRKRRSADPMPSPVGDLSYLDAKRMWGTGSADAFYYTIPRSLTGWGVSPALIHGWEAHNYLGFADAWSAPSMTDDEIVQAFHLPPAITLNPTAKQRMIEFIRVNGGQQVTIGGSTGLTPPAAPRNVRLQ